VSEDGKANRKMTDRNRERSSGVTGVREFRIAAVSILAARSQPLQAPSELLHFWTPFRIQPKDVAPTELAAILDTDSYKDFAPAEHSLTHQIGFISDIVVRVRGLGIVVKTPKLWHSGEAGAHSLNRW
jgi:hypothetical protein